MKSGLPLVLVALLLVLVPVADAQGMTENGFGPDRHLRAAYGDVPLSPAVEPDGRWNIVEYARIQHDGGQVSVGFQVESGLAIDGATCTCGNVTAAGGLVTSSTEVAAGSHVVALTYHVAAGGATDPVAIIFRPATTPWSAAMYVRSGQAVSSNAALGTTLAGVSHPEYTIHPYDSSATFGYFGLNIPATGTATAGTGPAAGTNPWLYAAAGLLVGMALWAFLVSRGAVQRRSRKQVATTAAHVEAAKLEPTPVLEGRKRALMAALKEIELARQANELDVPTYDTLKAELKKEAVTVMRAIDESKGQKA